MSTPAMRNEIQPPRISSVGDAGQIPADLADRVAQPSRTIVSAAVRFLRREPLLHFVLLGALIFGVDAVLHPPAKDDKLITVTKAMRQSFIDNFDEDKERVPSDAELEKMTESWVASNSLPRR